MQSVADISRFESSGRNFPLTGHVMAVVFSRMEDALPRSTLRICARLGCR
jgi:hypothetical protein